MRLPVLLFCCTFAFGQNTSPSSETKAPAPTNAPDRTACPTTSGVAVCIITPANLEVEAGGSRRITVTVTGTREQAVDWIVQCPGSQCGRMTNDLYTAPIVRPNPPEVTLTAVSKADSTVKASVIVHLVQRGSLHEVVLPPTVVLVHGPESKTEQAGVSNTGGGFSGGVFRIGGGVAPPRAIYAPEPEFTEEARKSNYEGVCTLALIVDTDGRPTNIRVLKSLGAGLDEKAIEAVKTWRFEPAMRDGHPVRVEIAIEVVFHLYQKSEHPK